MIFQRLISSIQSRLSIVFVSLALGVFTLVGCDSAGSSSSGSDVDVQFGSSSPSTSSLLKADEGVLEIIGNNDDTLRVQELRFIVSEVELEGDADSAAFETEKPAFVNLPLNSSDVVSVVEGEIPPGVYNEFDFEVEDADLDNDDDEEEEELQQLQDDIDEAGFTWPEDASLVTLSTFTPKGGTEPETPDTTYFDAEIEVEIELDDGRSFEIGTDDPERRLTVNLKPSSWFKDENGNPFDLSGPDFQDPDELFELEIENEVEEESEIDINN